MTGIRRRIAAGAGAALGLAMLPVLAAQPASAEGATDLFFSEYVEGSGNNKALEVFNGTADTVDLSGYSVRVYFNGSAQAGLTISLNGAVPPGDVFVLAQSGASAPVLAVADQRDGSGWFNGDDAITLERDGVILDSIGQIGVDPGSEWGSGLTSTQDDTLRRKASVTTGDTDPTNPFDPATQWDGFATDTFDGLGAHAGGPAPDIAPTVTSTAPGNRNSGVAPTESLEVEFSEPVELNGDAFSLVCAGTAIAFTVSGGPTTYTLAPESELPPGAACTLTVHADSVLDQDGAPTPMAGDRAISFTVADCSAGYTPAYEIQGSGSRATTTSRLSTQGVVVGDYEAEGLRGFYLQDPEGDGDPATSDAIFVFNGSDDDVELGDLVRVYGTTGEFQDQTQLSAFSNSVTVCGKAGEDDVPTVSPTDVTLPFTDALDRERYEGMLVSFPQELTVTELFQLGRFGQVTLSSGGRLDQPTNVAAPGEEAVAVQQANDLNRIVVDDASQGQNPDPILWARDGSPLTAENTLRGGDSASGLVGVMTYTWGGHAASPNAFRVRPIGALGGGVDFEAANPRTDTPQSIGGSLKVASFNVLNYFDDFSGCTGGVAPDAEPMDCRGADDQRELDRQAAKIVAALRGLDADVFGLIEIENDGYGPDSALADLVERLNAKAGAGTYRYLDVDARTEQVDALGDDAIKVAMIYKPGAVVPNGETAVLNTDSFVNGDSGEPRNRPALAQTFLDRSTGGRFTLVVNHLKSKGSDCDEDGDPDTGDGQGNCNQTRVDAAEELVRWIGTHPTGMADPDVLVMGDLNSYAMEDPVTAIKDAGYVDLHGTLEEDAYSYVFDGQWGYLDHALASSSLAHQVAGLTTWHINADEPPVLDYDTDFKSDEQEESLYAPTPFRSSDHDPVLVGLDLDGPL